MMLAAMALAACPPADDSGGAVPAPTPDDVSLRIDAAQNGQTVQVAVNQRFAVELVGVPTAGYVWEPVQVPDFLTRAGEATGNTSAEQGEPGFTGGNHWEVLMFAATMPGTGELVLEQRRGWETEEPASDTFRITIVAQ
jgi:predicted secreted protein